MGIFSKKQINIPHRRSSDLADSHRVSLSSMPNSFRKNINLNRYNNQTYDNSPRIQHHHLSIKRKKIVGILLVTTLAIVGLAILINQFTAAVSIKISNETTKPIDIVLYQDAVQDYLNDNPLCRLRFILDNKRLNERIASELSEVSSIVQNTTIGLGVTEFIVKFREPVASWKINDEQYYVDASGVAFKTNLFEEPGVTVLDNSGANIEAGSASISRKFLGFVGRIVSLSDDAGYRVLEAILPENTTRQLNIRLENPNLLVKMTIDRSAADQVGDMTRAVDHMMISGGTPSYIDVRVDDKVFYK